MLFTSQRYDFLIPIFKDEESVQDDMTNKRKNWDLKEIALALNPMLFLFCFPGSLKLHLY